MRIYGWSYPSQDVFFNAYPNKHLTYDHDDHKGNSVCLCGFCDKEITITNDLEVCPECNNDLVFPRCDW